MSVPAPPKWICYILVEHVYINRFVARLDFLGPKTKPLEVVKVKNFIIMIWDIYTSIPTESTMLITNMNEFLWYVEKLKSCDWK